MTTVSPSATLTEESLRAFAVAWYEALDRHDPLESVLSNLVPEGLEMVFPETTTYGVEGFAGWYDAVTHKFFDEAHHVVSVDVLSLTAERAEISVLVNWKASKWDAPAATSARLDFDAGQTWVVVAAPDGPRVARYVVDTFVPNPGSADL